MVEGAGSQDVEDKAVLPLPGSTTLWMVPLSVGEEQRVSLGGSPTTEPGSSPGLTRKRNTGRAI